MNRIGRCAIWLAVCTVLLGTATYWPSVASADEGASCIQVGWEQVDATCKWTYEEYLEASSSGDGHGWALVPTCIDPALGSTCAVLPCVAGGLPGFLYGVYRDGVQVGTTCVTVDVDLGPSREEILERFKELEWPGSQLIVEPKGGKTLVNLETIFYTTNTKPTHRTVRIAKTDVQIVATPVSYTWSFGDGATLVTAEGGRPYPAREVLHVYETTDDVKASVATTYSGEYKIGTDPWESLGETLTIPGPEVALEVLEATPQLVLQ